MKFYDTHCHLCCSPLLEKANEIINECTKQEVLINNVGVDVETSKICIEQANKYENCYAIVGVHPSEVNDIDSQIIEIKRLCENKKVVAIGETGLDYHYKPFEKQKQIDSFIKHINLAREVNLPLVVHTRDASDDTYKILKENTKNQKVLIHCFSGDKEELLNYLSLGCYISISGIITFKKSETLREIVKLIPKDKIVIETDSPYLAPVPFRGKECMPYYVKETFNTIQKILNVEYNTLTNIIYNNSINFFNING